MPKDLLEVTNMTLEYSGWKEKVANKGTFSIPQGYGLGDTTNKYARFTGYFRLMVQELLIPDDDAAIKTEAMIKWNNAKKDYSEIQDGWWEDAQKIGAGSNISDEKLPKFNGGATEEGKKLVYDTFIPAYRAIKESFDKRSIFQWIFNHRQYTAERDVLNAIKGIIFTFTGDSKEVLEAKVQEHKEIIPTTKIDDAAKKFNLKNKEIEDNIKQKEFDDKLDKIKEESKRIERENEEVNKQIEESKKNEIEEISIKKGEELTTQDQYKILTGDENFKKSVEGELYKEVKNSPYTEQMTKTFISNTVYKGLIENAQNFCVRFDIAKESGENLENVFDKNVKEIFKLAFTRVGVFRPSLKDRLIMAQAMTDIVLKSATPVGFEEKTYGKYAQNYVLKNDEEFIRSVIKTDKTIKEDIIDNDIKQAKNELGIVEIKDEQRIQMDIAELKEEPNSMLSSQHIENDNSKIIVNEIK